MRILLAWRAQFTGCSGGMERVLTNMANAMLSYGHKVAVMYCGEKKASPFFPISSQVKLYNMAASPYGQPYTMSSIDKLIKEMLRVYSKQKMFQWGGDRKNAFYQSAMLRILNDVHPDVIVSFDPSTTIMLRQNVKEIPMKHIVTMFHFPISVALRYHSTDEERALVESGAVQVLTKSAKEELISCFPDVRALVIPNAVYSGQEGKSIEHKPPYLIGYMARIDKVKQQHIAIEAFARLAPSFPDWNFELWGAYSALHPEYRAFLQNTIEKYHLERRVFLCGPASNAAEVYKKWDVLAFPSAREGFGLALAEGMSAGLPPVAFQSCVGASELIEDGVTGLLAKDSIENFADQLQILMSDPGLRRKIGSHARAAMQVYSPAIVWDQWNTLLTDISRR